MKKNAIYPVLFLDYLVQTIHGNDDNDNNESESQTPSIQQHPILRFCLLSTISIILTYINYLGLPLVGTMSVSISIISISPFIIMCLVGILFKGIEPSNWFIMPDDDGFAAGSSSSNHTSLVNDDDFIIDADDSRYFFFNPTFGGVLWRPYLNNLFWNLNSFDAVGCFAEDVHNPSTLLPKALHWSVVIVALGYFIPLLVAIGCSKQPTNNQSDWVDGYLAVIVENIGGKWLSTWIIFAAGISNIALFQAELSADSLAIMGMAENGYLPQIFTTRSQKYGTPTYGLLLCCLVIIIMSISSNLDTLIEMLNFNYGISLLMEYIAFIKLRISRPIIIPSSSSTSTTDDNDNLQSQHRTTSSRTGTLYRPYRIPLNTFGCILFFLPTIIMTLIVLSLASYTTFIVSIVVNIIFMSIYYAKEHKEKQKQQQQQGVGTVGIHHNDVYERVSTMLDDFSMMDEQQQQEGRREGSVI